MKKLLFLLSLVALTFMSFTVNEPNKFVTVLLLTQESDDAKTVQTIKTSLFAAEKVAAILNVELVADDVATDVFVFNIESEDQKNLVMHVFDEEGYELVGQRDLQISNGENYKALNVKTLEDGTYIFKLSDENGNELTKKFTIQN